MAALILPSSYETPWDSTPLFGISQKIGYVFLEARSGIVPKSGDVLDFESGNFTDQPEWHLIETPTLPTEKYLRHHDLLIIHGDLLPQLGEKFPLGSQTTVRVQRNQS